VYYTSPITQVIAPGQGTVTTTSLASSTGTGAVVLATSPTLVTPVLGAASATSITVAAGAVGTPSITTVGDTNTGIFFSTADTIDFVEGGVATGQFDSSGNFKFNSGYGSVATAYACRAWVNFNGTGTPAIRASGNVTSITDNGVGQYTINITNALTDTNFATLVSAGDTTVSSANSTMTYVGSKSTTTQFVAIRNGTNSDVDRDQILIAIFR
jgi:hypothetical protein